MVGRLARMRVSSVIRPSSSGTLQVGAQEDALAADVDVPDGLACSSATAHSRSAMKLARSATRQE